MLGTACLASAAGNQAHMTITGRTTQPIGHYEYCKVYRADCMIRSNDTRPVVLTKARWKEMVQVNDKANRQVKPVTDEEYYHVEEYWTYPDRYGDCEDYVLLKRRMLMQLGWPASALLVTVVRQANGDGHAVLTVRTDRADYVLDNLESRILPWNEAGYRYLKRQSASYSGAWEGIDDNRSTLVGSVK
jgi:predicted transglutaminase-like cysteine proteinase